MDNINNDITDLEVLTSKKIIVSVIENNFMPELKTYGPLYNAPLPIPKVSSLINRGVIVRFNKRSDLELVRRFVESYNQVADIAENINPTSRINRIDRTEEEINKAINRIDRLSSDKPHTPIEDQKRSQFDNKSDDEILHDKLIAEHNKLNEDRPDHGGTIEELNDFRDRVKLFRKSTNVEVMPPTEDNEFDGIVLK